MRLCTPFRVWFLFAELKCANTAVSSNKKEKQGLKEREMDKKNLSATFFYYCCLDLLRNSMKTDSILPLQNRHVSSFLGKHNISL